jgi:hypothetical protein
VRSALDNMAKTTETSSTKTTKSSVFSRKAVSLKTTVRRGAKAIARPLKKLKKAISTASTTRSTHSTTPPLSDDETVDDEAVDDETVDIESESRSAHGDDKVALTREEELGTLRFPLVGIRLITYATTTRGTQKELAFTYLFVLQARHCCSVP